MARQKRTPRITPGATDADPNDIVAGLPAFMDRSNGADGEHGDVQAADGGSAGVEAAEGGKKKRGKRGETPPTNVPDFLVIERANDAIAKKAVVDRIAAELKTANADYRNSLKTSKKLGVDPDMITWYLAHKGLDPADIDRQTAQRSRIARLMGLPLGTQLGLWADGTTVATLVDDDKMAAEKHAGRGILSPAELADAEDAGEFASIEGKPSTATPYEEGSPMGIRWHAGWLKDQTKKAHAMGSNGADAGATVN